MALSDHLAIPKEDILPPATKLLPAQSARVHFRQWLVGGGQSGWRPPSRFRVKAARGTDQRSNDATSAFTGRIETQMKTGTQLRDRDFDRRPIGGRNRKADGIGLPGSVPVPKNLAVADLVRAQGDLQPTSLMNRIIPGRTVHKGVGTGDLKLESVTGCTNRGVMGGRPF